MKRIKEYLEYHPCPHCNKQTMTIARRISRDLWNWKCSNCKKTGNVGYDLNELRVIDLPPDKQKEWEKGPEDWHDFIRKYGIERPKKNILLDQDPSLY